MSASGWQTAPLQAIDLEVVTVTKSACRQQLLEGSPGVSDLYHPAVSLSWELAAGRVVYPSHERTSGHPFESQLVPYPVRLTGELYLAT